LLLLSPSTFYSKFLKQLLNSYYASFNDYSSIGKLLKSIPAAKPRSSYNEFNGY
jgi:hypothetical protein